MFSDLPYQGSFQKGARFPSENPLEEVWARVARLSTPEYISGIYTSQQEAVEWEKCIAYASIRIRQSCELRNAGSSSSLLTKPITLYYSFLNLLRGLMALITEKISPSSHGLRYIKNSDLLLAKAQIVPGTFSSYLECSSVPFQNKSEITLKSCLSRIAEVSLEFNSPERGKSNTLPLLVESSMRTGEVRLNFDYRFVEESDFRANWSTYFPKLKGICQIGESGCSLKVSTPFGKKAWDSICEFCEKNLWNYLVLLDEPRWYLLKHENDEVQLSRAGYYFAAIFILGSIARYEPELLEKSCRPGSENEWFFNWFLIKAERFFPQLMLSWSMKNEVYLPGV